MKNIFLIALIISGIYILANLLEIKYFTNENDENVKTYKHVFKESLLVYLSVICGYYCLQQFTPAVENIIKVETSPLVFTDNPPF